MWQQEYVVGLEPATYPPSGRVAAREAGELLCLKPQEIRTHEIVLEVKREE